jgi:hypothetical protein
MRIFSRLLAVVVVSSVATLSTPLPKAVATKPSDHAAALVPAHGELVKGGGAVGARHLTALRSAAAKGGAEPNVTDPQGDSLSVTNVIYAQKNPIDSGDLFGACSKDLYASPGNNLAICAHISVYDSISGSHAPTTNSSHIELYDACNQQVATWDQSGWYTLGTSYLSNGWIYSYPYITVPSNRCFGVWAAFASFSETFTDGQMLTDVAMGTFAVVQSQQTPTGGAVQASEQYGGCGCGYVSHGQVATPVDTASGNFWHSFDDLAIPGRGSALDPSH